MDGFDDAKGDICGLRGGPQYVIKGEGNSVEGLRLERRHRASIKFIRRLMQLILRVSFA
jgi:hypothetical protein